MSEFHDDLELVISTDGVGAICKCDSFQDALFDIIEREHCNKQIQSFVAGVQIMEALEAYVESRAEEIRKELAGMPTREQMEAEWTRDYRRSV